VPVPRITVTAPRNVCPALGSDIFIGPGGQPRVGPDPGARGVGVRAHQGGHVQADRLQ
jgi:hypothetical protein